MMTWKRAVMTGIAAIALGGCGETQDYSPPPIKRIGEYWVCVTPEGNRDRMFVIDSTESVPETSRRWSNYPSLYANDWYYQNADTHAAQGDGVFDDIEVNAGPGNRILNVDQSKLHELYVHYESMIHIDP